MGNNFHDIPPYKEAYVYEGKNEQFVAFSYWSKVTGKYKREKVRFDIGARKLPYATKMKGLHHLCDELNAIIKTRNKRKIYHEDIVSSGQSTVLPFTTVIQSIIDKNIIDKKKPMPESTIDTMRGFLTAYRGFLKDNPVFELHAPSQIDDTLLEAFVEHQQGLGKVGKTINSYLWIIKTASELLHKKKLLDEIIETDSYRLKQTKNETGRFPPLTDEETEKVFNYYRNYKDGYYYLFLSHIYYTCIRPGELHRLKFEYFNFKDRTIFVPWYSSKNGLSSYVQMLEPLYNALIEKGYDKQPGHLYVFGNYCKPSAEQYSGKYASDTWDTHRPKIGLPKGKMQYGLKHTFNKNFVEQNKANIDWEWLRRHNRHATVQQTQDYISELTAYFLDESKAVIKNFHK
jgi:integrase